jgi:NOL1/NOP2/fmu family ribosome biogenesis protein
MPQLKFLNNKEIKEIYKSIEQQWGAEIKLDNVFARNNKGRVFIVSKDTAKIDLGNLRINSVGLYFCEIDAHGIRLSIEGSQIIGPKATKNVIEIDDAQVKEWFKGEDLEVEEDYSGFVIVKHNNDFLGSGKFKNGKILNYVSKSRRVSAAVI